MGIFAIWYTRLHIGLVQIFHENCDFSTTGLVSNGLPMATQVTATVVVHQFASLESNSAADQMSFSSETSAEIPTKKDNVWQDIMSCGCRARAVK